MSGKTRERSKTAGSQDLTRPRSAQPKKNPRKLVEKIDDLRRKGAEVDSAFHEVMGIRTEITNKLKPHGSMPVLTGDAPFDAFGNNMALPPHQPYNQFPSTLPHPSPVANGPNLNYPVYTTVDSYPTPPNTPATVSVQARNEHVDRFIGNNLTRHKSDSNLIQSLLQADTLQQDVQPLPSHHPLPHQPPLQSSNQSPNLAMSYSGPSTALSHSKPSGQVWGRSLPGDVFRRQRSNKPPYTPSSPKTLRARKHVSTNIPPSYDHLPSYPLSPMHYSNSFKGSTSSLPDLSDADFPCGLTTPIDNDETSMEGFGTNQETSTTMPKDFDSDLPTRQVPQAPPKKTPSYTSHDQYMLAQSSFSSTLSPLVDKPALKPVRSATVSSFTDLLEEGNRTNSPGMVVSDDSILMYSPHRTVSDTRGTPYPQDQYHGQHHLHYSSIQPHPPMDQKMAYSNHYPTCEVSSVPMNTTASRYQSTTAHSVPLSTRFKVNPNNSSSEYPSQTNADVEHFNGNSGFPGSLPYPHHQHNQQQVPMKLPPMLNSVQQYSFTTDSIPSSSAPHSAKRPPPSYYEHQYYHEPTSMIQERMTNSLFLGQDLTRSWSEENLFVKNPVQREKGSPLHNPFMGTVAAASSVPCVNVDSVEEVMASVIGQGSLINHTAGSPRSPTESASTEVDTPPATIRYDHPPPFTGQVNEWPLDPSRRESLSAQYRSLTDLNAVLNTETTRNVNHVQKPLQNTHSLSHQHSMPCLQDILNDIDVSMPFFDQSAFDEFLKTDSDGLNLGLPQYQPMD